jgi:branched-chain amino acid transport system permease protein
MNIKHGIRYGLIIMGIIFYLDLIGLPLTMGGSVVGFFAFLVGLFTVLFLRRRSVDQQPDPKNTLINSLVIGVISGLSLAVLTYIFAGYQAQGVKVHDTFAQVLPDHTAALTGLTKADILAGVSVIPGLTRLFMFFVVSALVGGGLTLLPANLLKANFDTGTGAKLKSGGMLALPILLFSFFLLLRQDTVQIGGSQENVLGLVVIFVFIGASLFSLRAVEPGLNKRVFGLVLAALVLLLPQIADQFQNAVLGKVAIFILMGIGLNIVVGFAGLLDLGYVAFFAIGAYAYALLSSPQSWVVLNVPGLPDISFWSGLPVGILLGIFAGVVLGIPVLRMRGDYLAIVTLGFGEIIHLVIKNLKDYTGGPDGILDVKSPILFGLNLGNPTDILYIALVFLVIATIITNRLQESRLGRAWIAMREDEDVAQAMGINLVSIKLLAFGCGAAFAAAGGVLYASRQVNIFPDYFELFVSINVLSLIIIGGIGSIDGVVLGSIALIGLPEILRSVDEYRILAFGALLVLMMILRPEGFLPSTRRKRELTGEEDHLAGADI